MEDKLEYFLLVFLIAMSAVFSASEMAFSCCSRIRLKGYANDGNKKAEKALKIADDFDRTLTAILVGNNVVNIGSATLGTLIFSDILGEALGGIVSTIVITIVVLIFGEVLPKAVAKENPEKFVMTLSGAMKCIIVVLTPFTVLLVAIKKLFSKVFISENDEPTITEEELIAMINEIEDEGVLEENESDLVKNALEFDEIRVSDILVPRVDVIAADLNDGIENIKDLFINEKYSRLPVYDKTIDNIVGVITDKDFFKLYIRGKNKSIKTIVNDTIFVHSLQKISEVFKLMQSQKQHLAIVTDQYGGTEGIVTLEDILEELVGEIYDESDDVEIPLLKVGENTYEVSAELSVHDMLEMLEMPVDLLESAYTSVGGWVMELIGRIPEEGDETEDKMFKIRVLKIFEQRIVKVRIRIKKDSEEE